MNNTSRTRVVASLLRRLARALLLLLAGAALPGCPRARTEGEFPRPLVVFAAASLRDAFTALGARFQTAHPGVEVTFNFAGTQELRTQLEHGAPVDVFASADTLHMQALVAAGRVERPVVFARNRPVIVVAKEKMADIRQLSELTRARRIVVGAPEVPIGRYTAQILARATKVLGKSFGDAVDEQVVSRELNVRQVLAKVSLGEAEAGIVYRTDAAAAGDRVAVVPIPDDYNVLAEYPVAVVRGAAQPQLARAFVEVLLSGAGQEALVRAGFAAAGGGSSR